MQNLYINTQYLLYNMCIQSYSASKIGGVLLQLTSRETSPDLPRSRCQRSMEALQELCRSPLNERSICRLAEEPNKNGRSEKGWQRWQRWHRWQGICNLETSIWLLTQFFFDKNPISGGDLHFARGFILVTIPLF